MKFIFIKMSSSDKLIISTKTFSSQSHVKLDPKEEMKLDKLVNGEGLIKREDFIEFSKKSQAVKEFGLRGNRSSTPVRKAEIDKAEVVFRVTIIHITTT